MNLAYPHHDAAAARPLVDQLVAVYLDVHADDDNVFYSGDRFHRQIDGHMTAPGWEVVTANLDGETVGFTYGFSLSPETRWWSGLLTDVPEGFVTETGHRTFALSELMVREAWRGKGVAHRLHDELLAGRREERATLLVRPDNDIAQAAYMKWGWQKTAQLRPGWEGAPTFEVLILPLQAEEHSSSH